MLRTKCVDGHFQMQCKIYNHAEMFDLKELLQTTEDFLVLSVDNSDNLTWLMAKVALR